MSQAAYFVTGTDTGVGKTRVSCALLHALARRHAKVVGMKPVAAGCEWLDGQWLNEDVAQLRAASTLKVPAEFDSPYALRDAVAPHIAAQRAGVRLDLNHLEACFHALQAQADAVVVEGAGGFLVPLHEGGKGVDLPAFNSADLAQTLALPVILVVGVRLGCLNHALLTQEAILRRGLKLAGWVANGIDATMLEQAANVQTLQRHIQAPMWAHWCWQPDATPALLADSLRLP
jgi:dethiobiotin synthetase